MCPSSASTTSVPQLKARGEGFPARTQRLEKVAGGETVSRDAGRDQGEALCETVAAVLGAAEGGEELPVYLNAS